MILVKKNFRFFTHIQHQHHQHQHDHQHPNLFNCSKQITHGIWFDNYLMICSMLIKDLIINLPWLQVSIEFKIKIKFRILFNLVASEVAIWRDVSSKKKAKFEIKQRQKIQNYQQLKIGCCCWCSSNDSSIP